MTNKMFGGMINATGVGLLWHYNYHAISLGLLTYFVLMGFERVLKAKQI